MTQDREGYALAAGLSLGMITLGQGRNAPGLSGVRLEERLRYFMLGGAEAGTVGSQRGVAAASGKGSMDLTDGVFSPTMIGKPVVVQCGRISVLQHPNMHTYLQVLTPV